MPFGSEALFKEDRWVETNDSKRPGDLGVLRFSRFDAHPVAKLVIKKFIAEHMLRDRGAAYSTVASHAIRVGKAMDALLDLGVFKGRRGEFIVGLSQLNDDDLLHLIDVISFKGGGRDKHYIWTGIYVLETIIKYCSSRPEFPPFMQCRLEMPWQTQGITKEAWIEQRANDLEFEYSDEQGFEALPPEIYQPLITNSVVLLEKKKEILAVFDRIKNAERTPSNSGFTDPVRAQFLAEFKGDFADIYPVKVNSNPKSPERLLATHGWPNELIKLAKGACFQIILLTTGLRISDVSSLKVGCCKPSGTIDSLYYIVVPKIRKTKNRVHLPVPSITNEAVELLAALKETDDELLFDETRQGRTVSQNAINGVIRFFANAFNIPFSMQKKEGAYSVHCYRSTVAGFLSESSNMAILMIRRLFGHSNDILPSFYQRNNPFFKEQQEKQHEEACRKMAHSMTEAVAEGRVSGPKGEDLKRGYAEFKNSYADEFPTDKSQSLTDVEIRQSFEELLYERFIDNTACGLLTPLGVVCMNNTNNPEPTPCGRRSNKAITDEASSEMLHLIEGYSTADPAHCVGVQCPEAAIGPWSTSLLESLHFNKRLLRHELGDLYADQHFHEYAASFVRTYEPLLSSVWKDLSDGRGDE